MGMIRSLTMAYHPQANGQTEVLNQSLEISLRAYVGPSRNDWVNYLDALALSYNTCGCGPLLCMAGILVPFSNELITGVRRGLVGPLIYMAELSQHHLI